MEIWMKGNGETVEEEERGQGVSGGTTIAKCHKWTARKDKTFAPHPMQVWKCVYKNI